MTDRELVLWALFHGWGWRASLKQLVDCGGTQHRVTGWDDIGEKLRTRIIEQMEKTPKSRCSLCSQINDVELPTVQA